MNKILIVFSIVSFLTANPTKTIEFKSLDGVPITADLYGEFSNKAPVIILFHQAGWSRGEYHEIAPKLLKMGFDCMAIDQRSGKGVNNVRNETKIKADKMAKGTKYLDAYQDMEAVFHYAKDTLGISKIIVWGSSYSAALTFVLTAKYQTDLSGMLAFAPGEYFESAGKSADYIQTHAAKINIPVFITSAKSEYKNWEAIMDMIPAKQKTSFLPETEGQHGSRALWEKFPEHKQYWEAVSKFLETLK